MITNGHRNSVKPWSGHRGLNGLVDRAYSESEDDYSDDSPVYENVEDEDDVAVYENVPNRKEHVYDDPAVGLLNLPVLRTDTGVYENMDFDVVDECGVYENVNDGPTYDVPQRRPLVVDTGRGNQHYSNLDSGPLIPAPDYDSELGSRPAAMETLKSLSGYKLSGLPALATLRGLFTAPSSVSPQGNGSHESALVFLGTLYKYQDQGKDLYEGHLSSPQGELILHSVQFLLPANGDYRVIIKVKSTDGSKTWFVGSKVFWPPTKEAAIAHADSKTTCNAVRANSITLQLAYSLSNDAVSGRKATSIGIQWVIDLLHKNKPKMISSPGGSSESPKVFLGVPVILPKDVLEALNNVRKGMSMAK